MKRTSGQELGLSSLDGYLSHKTHTGAWLTPLKKRHSLLFKCLCFPDLFTLIPNSTSQATLFHLHGLHSFLQKFQGQGSHFLGQDRCGSRSKSVTASSRREEGQPFRMQPVQVWLRHTHAHTHANTHTALPSRALTSAQALWVCSMLSAAWHPLQ